MQTFAVTSVLPHLVRWQLLLPDEPAAVRELDGGVSNTVLLVERTNRGDRLVVKQALPQLKVQQPWFCGVERIWREVDVLRICGQLLADTSLDTAAVTPLVTPSKIIASVPQILAEDRENFAYAMTAAPFPHQTWKEELLSQEVRPEIAAACGRMLGQLHGRSWHDSAIAQPLADRSFFDQLRLDPYYRQIAKVHPDLQATIGTLIEQTLAERHALVHGDFSPKNLLVSPRELTLIDFEVGHYGDPAFDLGFFNSHLVLKSIWAPPDRQNSYRSLVATFWSAYLQALQLCGRISAVEIAALGQRAAQHLGGCLLARIDGKSPVNYLPESAKPSTRLQAKRLLQTQWHSWEEALQAIAG